MTGRKLVKAVFNVLLLLSLVFLVSGLASGCNSSGNTPVSGKKLANFRLDTLDHERFYLNRQEGNVVVLVFWTTWCRVCKTEMVELQAMIRQKDFKNVTIAAVCCDPENLDDVKRIVKHLNISYPVLLDRNASLFKKYQLAAYPTTIIIDRQQRLSYVRTGYDSLVLNQIKAEIIRLAQHDDPT